MADSNGAYHRWAWRVRIGPRAIWPVQAAGRPRIRLAELASLFPHRKLCPNLDYPDVCAMAYELSAPLKVHAAARCHWGRGGLYASLCRLDTAAPAGDGQAQVRRPIELLQPTWPARERRRAKKNLAPTRDFI